jgi:hypothetical protein
MSAFEHKVDRWVRESGVLGDIRKYIQILSAYRHLKARTTNCRRIRDRWARAEENRLKYSIEIWAGKMLTH